MEKRAGVAWQLPKPANGYFQCHTLQYFYLQHHHVTSVRVASVCGSAIMWPST